MAKSRSARMAIIRTLGGGLGRLLIPVQAAELASASVDLDPGPGAREDRGVVAEFDRLDRLVAGAE
jgi:hypothetical protein